MALRTTLRWMGLGLTLGLSLAACSDDGSQEDDSNNGFDWPVDNAATATNNGTGAGDAGNGGTSSGTNNASTATNNASTGTTDGDVGPDTPPPCQCPEGERCDEGGQCVPDVDCFEDDDCEGVLVCREGRCEPECITRGDCEGDQLCVASQCVDPECAADADCDDPIGQTCAGGFCEANACQTQTFTFDPGATTYASVHVAGSFNGWPATRAEGGLEMTFSQAQGIWYVKETIPNGQYQYKFVLNDGAEWIADPGNPNTADDGFGGRNSVLNVACDVEPPVGACGDVEAFDWRDAVMYFLLVDRFYDSDGIADEVPGATGGNAATGPSGQYEGGDLKGVEEKLDYLRDLGVTALWLSAPFENRDAAGDAIDPNSDPNVYSAYHGYWPSPANIDYSDPDNPNPRPRVESRIGTEQDLRDLVDASHSIESVNGEGIRVLLDYVMNHVDVDSGLYQAHNDWFARRDGRFALCGPENLWNDPYWGTRCAFTDYLPPFDFDNAAARAWSVNDAVWWAKEFNLDGYRLDAIKHVSLQWLTDLRLRLNEAFPEPDGGRFYLVGETFAYDDANLIRSFVNPDTMLDGQFDFPLKARLCEAVFTPGGSFENLSSWMSGNDTFYGPRSIMTTWIGNHDIPRPIHFASGQIGNCREGSFPGNGWTNQFNQPSDAVPYERLGVSFAVLMTNPGIPLIYYGDEVGLAGGGDPDNRRMMPWEDSAINPAQRDLRNTVALLARIRAQNKVLSRGVRNVVSVNQDTWVYTMTGCGDDAPDVTVAINRADGERAVNVPAGDYTDLVSNAPSQGGSVTLPPRSFRIWRAN